MKNRVNIQTSNGSTMKTNCSKTMFWQLQIQGTLLFLMHCLFLSQMTPHWWLLIHTRGQQEVCWNNLWCSIVFCRTEQRGPLLSKGSSDLKASSTDRCGDRDLKPQKLEGIARRQSSMQIREHWWSRRPLPPSPPPSCVQWLLSAGICCQGDSNQRIYMVTFPQQQSLVCRGHHADRVTWLIPHFSANWPWWSKKDARMAQKCTGQRGGGV